jgi:hypothetical protein
MVKNNKSKSLKEKYNKTKEVKEQQSDIVNNDKEINLSSEQIDNQKVKVEINEQTK